jgi:AcrR family transcriptional regulator
MTLEQATVREKLVKTALKLMEKGGLEDVKARKVAEIAGVSVGTIYNFFGNFDRLILAANVKVYEELGSLGITRAQQIEEEIARKQLKTPRERVLARLMGLAETYVDFVAANANRWAALLAFNRTRGLSSNEDNSQHLNALIDIVGRMLEEAPIWRRPTERRAAARALWSAVHGVVSTNFFGVEEKVARARTTELLSLLLATLVDGMFAAA